MLTIKFENLDKVLKDLKDAPKELGRAIRNAVNTTATAVKNLGIDEAFKAYHVDKKKRLKTDNRGKDTTHIARAKEGETSATVTFFGGGSPKSTDRIGLQHFKTDKQQRNIKKKGWQPSYQIKRGGKIEKVERGFYAHGAGFTAKGRKREPEERGTGLWQRDPTRTMGFTDYKTGKRRIGQMIVRRTGPSLKMMVEDEDVLRKVEAGAKEILKQKTEEAVVKQLAKIQRKR